MRIWRNPFVLEGVWARRGRSLPQAAGVTLTVVALLIGAIAGSVGHAWIACATLWLAALGVQAMFACIGVFARDAEIGALQAVALIPMSAFREAVGRWAGASLELGRSWLLMLFFALSGPLVLHQCAPSPVQAADPSTFGLSWCILLWLFVGVWAAALSTTGLVFSALLRRRASAVLALATTFLVVSLLPKVGALELYPYLFAPVVLAQFGTVGVIATSLLVWSLYAACALMAAAGLIGCRFPHFFAGLEPRLQNGAHVRDVSGSLKRGYAGRRRLQVGPFAIGVACAVAAVLADIAWGVAPWTRGGIPSFHAQIFTATCLGCLFAGLVVGWNDMSREVNLNTLELLLLTGLAPVRIVSLKFLRGARALAAISLAPLPMWVVVAVHSGRPALALFGLWTPLCTALGLMAGMNFGLPRKRVTRTFSVGRIVGMVLILVPMSLILIVPVWVSVAFAFFFVVPIWCLDPTPGPWQDAVWPWLVLIQGAIVVGTVLLLRASTADGLSPRAVAKAVDRTPAS